MPVVRAQRRTTGLEAMSKSLSKVLDTITEIKQQRGRQQLNAAVMQAISQPGTPDERRTAATDAVSGVRNQPQGASGILGGIMNIFDPRVATFARTAPIEELLAGTMVRDLTSRSSFESAQLLARNRNQQMLISAENQLSKLQGDLREYMSGAEVSVEGVNPEQVKSFGTQIDFWQRRVQDMLQRLQPASAPSPTAQFPSNRLPGFDPGNLAGIDADIAQGRQIAGAVAAKPVTKVSASAATPTQTTREIHVDVDSGLLDDIDFLKGREAPPTPVQAERVNALLADLEIDVEGIRTLWDMHKADVVEVLKVLDNGTLSRDGAIAVLKKLQEQ